jgi:hypothetical protein
VPSLFAYSRRVHVSSPTARDFTPTERRRIDEARLRAFLTALPLLGEAEAIEHAADIAEIFAQQILDSRATQPEPAYPLPLVGGSEAERAAYVAATVDYLP